MERNYQHIVLNGAPRSPFASTPRSPFTANSSSMRTRHGSGSTLSTPTGRRNPLGLGTTGLRKDTPGKGVDLSCRYSISGRSNQSVLGIRSEFNVIESYGLQLPVSVNEVLTFNEKNLPISVQCCSNGWAWLVQGRRLFVWQYKSKTQATPSKGSRAAQRTYANCRELTLPHCDIGHKAALITVFYREGHAMASCIAVSPTGDVRYWPSIAHDINSTDKTGVLEGQEFEKLLELPETRGYLIATTTCNLVHLWLSVVKGRTVLQHKPIKQPVGILSGIGRRFSLIIGMGGSHDKESKFINIASEVAEDDQIVATILSERCIQRWRIANPNEGVEQMMYEDTELIRKLREEFQHKFWNSRVAETVEMQMYLLDMQKVGEKFYILASAVNTMHTPQMHYGIAIATATETAMKPLNFIPLKYAQFFSSATERECLRVRLIISPTHLYFYNEKVVYPLSLMKLALQELEADKIEFHTQDDRILGAAICENVPLFFSNVHGIVSITPGDFEASDLLQTSSDVYPSLVEHLHEQTLIGTNISENNLYIFGLDPDEIYKDFKDDVSQLKAAFIYRLKRKNNMCNTIVSELLTSKVDSHTGVLREANHLDKIVLTIAEDLVEDIPAGDPRWEQKWESPTECKLALGSSTSLQIITQLREKHLALQHFVDFLHSSGIWEMLNAIPSTGGSIVKPTCYVISDLSEKIIAAIALRTIQNKYQALIEDAITYSVNERREAPQGNLTAQDLFYVRISKFQDIFQSLVDVANSLVDAQHNSAKLAAFICDVNAIVLQIITEVHKYREENASTFSLPASKLDTYEYLPWTAMAGNVGVRDALTHLIEMSVQHGARAAYEPSTKQKLYQQILELIDFVLDGKKSYLDSVRDTEKYNVLLQQFEAQRRSLISMLIEDEQFESAAKLAEKYLDFQSLIIICDATKDEERFNYYMKKYEEYEFSQFAINWHMRENRQGEVFERFKNNQGALAKFMRAHPSYGWIQLIFNGDFARASKILCQLADNETEYVERKTMMLSLAKLSALAAPDSDMDMEIDHIDNELYTIAYQYQLPPQLLEAFGYDPEEQRVLKVEEMINLFITEENETATEHDFRKAIELLDYLEEPYDARHKIWCAAILRDNWVDYDPNNAEEYLQNTLFFKLIFTCYMLERDLDNFLPSIDDFLNSTDLKTLPQNESFRYLLKLTYEHVYECFKRIDDD